MRLDKDFLTLSKELKKIKGQIGNLEYFKLTEVKFSEFIKRPYVYFFLVFILIIVSLFLFKPSFIKQEDKETINIINTILYSLMIAGLLTVGINYLIKNHL